MYTLCIGFFYLPLPYMWYHRLKQAEVTANTIHNVYTTDWVLLLTTSSYMWYHKLKQAGATLTPYTMYTLCIGFFYLHVPLPYMWYHRLKQAAVTLTPYTMYTLSIGFFYLPLPYMWYHRLKQADDVAPK